ncbi:LysR family transcriptional regulator [Vibrio cidicii]|uniref:LysR family transcriptional regulator n=1 Tax=Vibrio cidicii TaxID=1763883 RepID=UPI00375307EA
MSAKISLEMWRTFIAVAEHGSTVKAAEQLHKSQSAISHSINKLSAMLGKELFVIEGRQSVLTELGKQLLPKVQELHHNALQIEKSAMKFEGELAQEISIAVDVLLPARFVLEVIDRFHLIYPHVSLRVYETALSGASQLLGEGSVSLAIASALPKEMKLEPLFEVPMLCVCAHDFALAQRTSITQAELKAFRHVVIRDSGNQDVDSGWRGSHLRLTVTHPSTALNSILDGVGFGWLPQHLVQPYLNDGRLVRVDLESEQTRSVKFQLGIKPDQCHNRELWTLFEFFSALCAMALSDSDDEMH